MTIKLVAIGVFCVSSCVWASISPNLSGLQPGPVKAAVSSGRLEVQWDDERSRHWKADFSLDSRKPLIDNISVAGQKIVDRAIPVYRCSTGKRRGGWDAFFDFLPARRKGQEVF